MHTCRVLYKIDHLQMLFTWNASNGPVMWSVTVEFVSCYQLISAWYFISLSYPLSCTWWRHHLETFSAPLAICAGIHRSPVNSPHKGQWRGDLAFSLICVWINDWVNNREAGDLRRYRTHYDVIVCVGELQWLTTHIWITREIRVIIHDAYMWHSAKIS